MTKTLLKFISDKLIGAGINYEFGEWNSEIVYPYFVGEYADLEVYTEDGLQESDFTLNGFTRGSFIELETVKEKIEKLFSNCIELLSNGSGIMISYSGSLTVPTGDAELKRIQISLSIKEWKVN